MDIMEANSLIIFAEEVFPFTKYDFENGASISIIIVLFCISKFMHKKQQKMLI